MQFKATLKNDSGEIQVFLAAGNLGFSVTDVSNYDDAGIEPHHARVSFAAIRKLTIKIQNEADVLFSSEVTGDLNYPLPSTGTDTITYTRLAPLPDGVYELHLFTVPGFKLSGDYHRDDDYVAFHNGTEQEYYRCIQDTLAAAIPVTDTAYWLQVTEAEVPIKYTEVCTFALKNALCTCLPEAIEAAACNTDPCRDLCGDPAYAKATKLFMLNTAIDSFACKEDWDKVRELFNLTRQICGC